MSGILVVGLNPAWQQIFTLPAPSGDQRGLVTGGVNRATDSASLASGKGLNAAKILAGLGHKVSLLQVVAGSTGARVVAACEARGIRSLHVEARGETRTCVTLLHDGAATEIIGPFSVSASGSDSGLRGRVIGAMPPTDRYDAVLICGTAPAGLDAAIYGDVVARVTRTNTPLVIWDSVAGLAPEILTHVTWLKVNAEEHRALSPLLANPATRPSLLITDGAAPASVRTGAGALTCAVPRLGAVLNPIGAGDTTTALLADGLLRGLDTRAAVARALAAASASCLDVLPAEWDPAVAARLEADILWTAA